MIDPRTPVIIGVGQRTCTDRSSQFSASELFAEAAERALTDTGVNRAAVTDRLDYLGAVDCFTAQIPDLAAATGKHLGVTAKQTVATRTSGTSPIELLSDAGAQITEGSLDVALLGGVEVVKAWKQGQLIAEGPQAEGTAPDRTLGLDRAPSHEAELAAGLTQPAQYYPLFENAIRAADGASIAEHDQRLGRLWSRFADIARENEYAWQREGASAEEILRVGPDNRMVATPYRKLLTANIFVNQSAALVVCAAETAEALGVSRDRWVFLEASAAANDHWFAGERQELHSSPAITAIGAALRDNAGLGIDEFAHLDLYSCFPCAVRIGADALGVDLADPGRAPTVTGGLTFAGGPGSNYVTHSLAAMVERLREHPGDRGLCTALGWFLTKHAAISLTTHEPANPYRHIDAQSTVDAQPRREIATGYTGTVQIETYTCSYDRAGEPETGYLSGLLPDGRRVFAASADSTEAANLVATDPLGSPARITEAARFRLG